ncbi:acyl-CoA synthetase long-chain family member 1 isoform X1 [Mucor ambiguus]|uniref:Acyl-CoA synthetase long-chain family member 1 isoform X1 n=1 Tax=Mucor ambiguus TaxID=91626 RepID=A0A0C9MQY7_9FUNG|nr:acyl-CoA synthetase long-chain family member 1 isoform X1 [Mucor ambiguus]
MTIELNTVSYLLLTAIFSAASFIAIQNGKHPDVHPSVLNKQSDYATLRYPGESAIIKSNAFPNGAPQLTTRDRPIKTLSELYQVALNKHKGKRFAGARDSTKKSVIWQSYDGAYEKTQHIYSGLIYKAKLEASTKKESSFVGIYASNSPDTFWTEMACHWGGLVTVPIAAQATSSHIVHVIRDTKLTTLVIDETHLEYVLHLVEGTSVNHIIALGEDANYKEQENYFGLSITSFSQLQKLGKEHPMDRSETSTSDSIASIYYSTNSHKVILDVNDPEDGKSLGVVLTHKVGYIYKLKHNVLIFAIGILSISSYLAEINILYITTDNVLGYVLQAMTCFVGGSIGFEDKVLPNEFNLDVPSVLSAIKEVKPTIYASGGPFLKQVQKLILGKYGNSFLFQRGLERKDRYHKEGKLVSDCKYDMLVFRYIRQQLFGGHIRMLYLDNDDVPKVDMGSFYRSVLGAQVLKTFSCPETSSSMMTTVVFDYALEKRVVGPPLPSVRVKLVDKKEEGYTAEDSPNPRGEIHVAGSTVFVGYWNNPLATVEAIDPDGWFSTGIIGELLPNGSILLLESSK